MVKKLQCAECMEEFTVTTKSHQPITYCVFCNEALIIEDDEDDEDEDDPEFGDEDL